VEKQIPSLRCGMTNKRTGNDNSNDNSNDNRNDNRNDNSRFLRCAAE
jgi:hypothetical protein